MVGVGRYSIPRTGKGKEVWKYEVCSWIRGLICLAKTEDFYEKNDKKFTALLVRANEYVMHLIGGREPVSMWAGKKLKSPSFHNSVHIPLAYICLCDGHCWFCTEQPPTLLSFQQNSKIFQDLLCHPCSHVPQGMLAHPMLQSGSDWPVLSTTGSWMSMWPSPGQWEVNGNLQGDLWEKYPCF